MMKTTISDLYLKNNITKETFACLIAYLWIDNSYTATVTAPINIKESKKAGRYKIECKLAKKASLIEQNYFKFTKEEYLTI